LLWDRCGFAFIAVLIAVLMIPATAMPSPPAATR